MKAVWAYTSPDALSCVIETAKESIFESWVTKTLGSLPVKVTEAPPERPEGLVLTSYWSAGQPLLVIAATVTY